MEMLGIIWIACWIATIIVSSKKGEGGIAIITGFFFGPLALIFALAGKGKKEYCPKCRELIDKKAVICPHCRSEITINKLPSYDEIKKQSKEV